MRVISHRSEPTIYIAKRFVEFWRTQKVSNPQRFKTITLERSIEYMRSRAFTEVYGNNGDPFWTNYKRNFKGHIAPKVRRWCFVS